MYAKDQSVSERFTSFLFLLHATENMLCIPRHHVQPAGCVNPYKPPLDHSSSTHLLYMYLQPTDLCF